MAKQIDDKTTMELPELPKKRGRPATGKAMTAAQRKRLQRERDAVALHAPEVEGGKPVEELTITALMEGLADAVKRGRPLTAQQLADELVRRAHTKKEIEIKTPTGVRIMRT